MNVSRRGFLAGLIALPATALAAKLALPSLGMAEEVRGELIKDMNKTVVAMPGQTEPVWYSVAGVADYWTDEIIKNYRDKIYNRPVTKELVRPMAVELARRIDKDLAEAKIPKEKQVIVGMPMLRHRGAFGGLELVGGVSKSETIFGEEVRVEYIRPTELILPANY